MSLLLYARNSGRGKAQEKTQSWRQNQNLHGSKRTVIKLSASADQGI